MIGFDQFMRPTVFEVLQAAASRTMLILLHQARMLFAPSAPSREDLNRTMLAGYLLPSRRIMFLDENVILED